MDFLKNFEDNHFDIAIVDPPYFSGKDCMKSSLRGKCRAKNILMNF